MSEGVNFFTIHGFCFASGEERTVCVAYRSFNPSARRVALIPTCFGQRINDVMNFANGALKDFHVIVVGMFAGGESSSPSNDCNFPSSVTYQDCVNGQYALLTQHFRFDSVEVVLGSSMGAQQVFYWAVMHGSKSEPFVKKAIAIVGSARTSGHCYAFLEGPLVSLTHASDYSTTATALEAPLALKAFGSAFCAWTTSAEWYKEECWRQLGCRSLQEYLKSYANNAFLDWHPQDLLTLVRMWQRGDAACIHPSKTMHVALAGIQSEVLVIPSRTDQYFTLSDCLEDSKYFKNGFTAIMDTIWGHIAGGGATKADTEFLHETVADFIK